jgi:hypothetical protein
MTTPLLVGGLIAALASPAPPTQPPAQSMACSLLTAGDIQAATGVKPDGEAHPAQFSPPGSKEPMQMCTWVDRAHRGQVVISTAHLPPGGSAKDYVKNPGTDALREQHWKEESKDFGNAWCSVMTPPAGRKDGIMMSFCVAGPKGWLLSVVYTSPTQKLSIEQIKALLDKAAARLP